MIPVNTDKSDRIGCMWWWITMNLFSIKLDLRMLYHNIFYLRFSVQPPSNLNRDYFHLERSPGKASRTISVSTTRNNLICNHLSSVTQQTIMSILISLRWCVSYLFIHILRLSHCESSTRRAVLSRYQVVGWLKTKTLIRFRFCYIHICLWLCIRNGTSSILGQVLRVWRRIVTVCMSGQTLANFKKKSSKVCCPEVRKDRQENHTPILPGPHEWFKQTLAHYKHLIFATHHHTYISHPFSPSLAIGSPVWCIAFVIIIFKLFWEIMWGAWMKIGGQRVNLHAIPVFHMLVLFIALSEILCEMYMISLIYLFITKD